MGQGEGSNRQRGEEQKLLTLWARPTDTSHGTGGRSRWRAHAPTTTAQAAESDLGGPLPRPAPCTFRVSRSDCYQLLYHNASFAYSDRKSPRPWSGRTGAARPGVPICSWPSTARTSESDAPASSAWVAAACRHHSGETGRALTSMPIRAAAAFTMVWTCECCKGPPCLRLAKTGARAGAP